jgi:hypothetical protein
MHTEGVATTLAITRLPYGIVSAIQLFARDVAMVAVCEFPNQGALGDTNSRPSAP